MAFCVLGMFVLPQSQGTISSEDVIGLSVCTLGRLGGVSPAHISQIDLPQRQALVPGSPAASAGPADGQQGEMGKSCVDNSCRRPLVCFKFSLRPGDTKQQQTGCPC